MSQDYAERLKGIRKSLELTQLEMAQRLGVSRPAYASYESGRNNPPRSVVAEIKKISYGDDVRRPTAPAAELEVPLVSIGYIAASSKIDWTDPFLSGDFEYVPGHMAQEKGRFSCRVSSDSMMPLLEPDDICVFQGSDVPKIGCIILFRSFENLVTIKMLKHDGKEYSLHPLNPNYEACKAEGSAVGYLVGIVRKVGRRTITDYDPDGIRPRPSINT